MPDVLAICACYELDGRLSDPMLDKSNESKSRCRYIPLSAVSPTSTHYHLPFPIIEKVLVLSFPYLVHLKDLMLSMIGEIAHINARRVKSRKCQNRTKKV